ncbi:hypothetical protein B6U90_02460 [Thermoplasmatales archaeon ex4484_6]|nr:MAG: hypothetical protein B6U90_02460 [Thermoplasmatales archaeon ex4484_6]RLF69618.1 MAG: hypothetical protein DRN57_00345 [Thermoplasmata archaeon]
MTPRVRRIRSTNPIYLIVTEGETEQKYFEGLRRRCPRKIVNRIYVKNPNDTDLMSLIKYCCDQIHQMELNTGKGDRIFCVVDYPQNEKVIPNSLKMTGKKGIELIFSRPCFELWFLLHFKRVFASLNNREIMKELKKKLPKYRKADKRIFEKMEGMTETAISNAESIGITNLSDIRNPSTNVQELVKFILKLIKEEE